MQDIEIQRPDGRDPTVRVPPMSSGVPRGDVALRSTRLPGRRGSVSAATGALDPDLHSRTCTRSPRRSIMLARSRDFPREASAVMAGLAVLLALVGLYGVLAASVDRRRRELAIRAAIGASPGDILAGLRSRDCRWLLARRAGGVGAGLATTRVLARASSTGSRRGIRGVHRHAARRTGRRDRRVGRSRLVGPPRSTPASALRD